jgi:hypothetical protein
VPSRRRKEAASLPHDLIDLIELRAEFGDRQYPAGPAVSQVDPRKKAAMLRPRQRRRSTSGKLPARLLSLLGALLSREAEPRLENPNAADRSHNSSRTRFYLTSSRCTVRLWASIADDQQ